MLKYEWNNENTGSVIYGWECEKREMIARLDVGKLLPVKESIEEELNSKPLQVYFFQLLTREFDYSISVIKISVFTGNRTVLHASRSLRGNQPWLCFLCGREAFTTHHIISAIYRGRSLILGVP